MHESCVKMKLKIYKNVGDLLERLIMIIAQVINVGKFGVAMSLLSL
jgi:hypothetical protein